MPTKKAKKKLSRCNERGYATSSVPRKKEPPGADNEAARLVWVELTAVLGGVSFAVGPVGPTGAAVPATGGRAPAEPSRAPAAEPSAEAGASSADDVAPAILRAKSEPAGPSRDARERGPASSRNERSGRAAAAAEARAKQAAEALLGQGAAEAAEEEGEEDMFLMDEDIGPAGPRAAPEAVPRPSSGRAERVSAPADYAGALSPLGTSPATSASQPIPAPPHRSIDAGRSWRPGETASSVPLDRYASSAPADLAASSAWPLPSPSSSSVAEPSPLAALAQGAQGAQGAQAAAADDSSGDESDEGVMCAICHGNIKPLQVAMIRGCEHAFCCGCILNWALQKSKCPLCQVPFTHLWMYRQLDGEYNDYLVEESVELLHCASWFRKAVSASTFCDAPADPDDYHEMLQYRYGGAEEEEDDEDYYYGLQERLQRAPARGNRRWGAGGFVQGGRRAARASPLAPPMMTTPKKHKAWEVDADCGEGSHGEGRHSSGGSGASRKANLKAEKAAQKEGKKAARQELVRAKKAA